MVRTRSWGSSWRSRSSGLVPTPSSAAASRSPATPELPPTLASSPATGLPALIVIAGATATGKTSLSLALAAELPGVEIVSADSRQVYRGLDIGTAKASPEDRVAVPHHGLDLVDPDEPFSVADYQRHVHAVLSGVAARGNLALLVGGTGLYLRAVARGLPLERIGHDPEVRAELEERLQRQGLATLLAELEQRDPAAVAAIDRANPRRVVRALERVVLTGSGLPPEPLGYAAPVRWLGLRPVPDWHRAAIEARVEAQFATGLLEEAERLRRRYREDSPAFSAMGYREAFDVLAGRRTIAEAQALDARRTWAYARRQATWFRGEPGITWITAGEAAVERARAELEPFLRSVGRAVYPVGR